jgi:hypothetical protein
MTMATRLGVGGPLLASGVVGFEALEFGGQLFGKSCGLGRTGWSCWAWASADCRRASAWAVSRSWLLMSGGPLAGALTLEGSCFELAAEGWPAPAGPHHGPAGAKADYFPLSKLRTGLPNGNGLPPTDTMAVPR